MEVNYGGQERNIILIKLNRAQHDGRILPNATRDAGSGVDFIWQLCVPVGDLAVSPLTLWLVR